MDARVGGQLGYYGGAALEAVAAVERGTVQSGHGLAAADAVHSQSLVRDALGV